MSVALLGLATGPSSAAVAAKKKPKKGGTLTYVSYFEPPGQVLAYLPAGIRDAAGNAERLAIFDSLVVVKNDKVSFRLAKSLTTTDGGTTWTMKLRPGVEFTDGSPFNAEAVVYNWDFIADPANATLIPSGVAAMSAFASWTEVDDLTVEITLKAPLQQLPYFLSQCSCTFIGSKVAQEAMGDEAFVQKPIGAGAFKIVEYQRGSQLILERNKNYYKKGRPYLKRVIFKFVNDDQQRYNTIVAGGGDIGTTRDYNTAARAEDAGYATKGLFLAGGIGLIYNSGIPPFDDVRAREAVALAIDVDALNQAVFNGHGVLATSLFPPGSQYYDKSGEQAKANATKAQALFDELAAEGKPVEFAFMTVESAPYLQLVQFIGARLAGFDNVKMTIDTQTSSSFLGPYLAKTYQLFTGAFVVDPTSVYRYYYTTGPNNRFNYSNPEFDRVITEAVSSLDPAQSKAAFIEAAKILKDDYGVFYLIRSPNVKYYDKSVIGNVPLFYDSVIDVSRVWRKKKS